MEITLDTIYNMDCLDGLRKMEDATVDCCVTSPPYFAALIDRINGRGTWQDNPWVVSYTMDLQRAEGFKEQETNK